MGTRVEDVRKGERHPLISWTGPELRGDIIARESGQTSPRLRSPGPNLTDALTVQPVKNLMVVVQMVREFSVAIVRLSGVRGLSRGPQASHG